jgi:NAD(P)-dependent dehydrogenase (short-subunit alcohol dehydrogenase family)
MQDFSGKVAVITGAASGIGRGLVEHCADLDMKLVLADVDEVQLTGLGAELRSRGIESLCVTTDVADAAAVEALAVRCFQQFNRVDLLFNNAGVLLSGYSWERSVEDWQWLLNINVMGVVHGIHSFVPRMLEQGGEAHIVNTASIAAFLAAPLMGPYTVSKTAVLALTETLYYELQMVNPDIGVSVLCPGQVASAIADSGESRDYRADVDGGAARAQLQDFLRRGIADGMPPARCAEIVFEAIRQRRFWIFPHPEFKPAYRELVREMLKDENPVYSLYEED